MRPIVREQSLWGMEFMLSLGFAALTLAILFVGLMALVYAGSHIAGRMAEWIFDLVVPARPSRIGADGMIGQRATVAASFAPLPEGGSVGTVRVSGETWNARCEADSIVPNGAALRVAAVDELLLLVERV